MKTPKPPSRQSPRAKPGQSAQVVDEFLEALLEPVQEYHPAQEQAPTLARKTLRQRQEQPGQAATLAERLPKVRLPTRLAPPKVEVQPEVQRPSAKPRPGLYDQPFQCLLFHTLGSEFAVPLAALSGILRWDGQAAKLPGQPVWHRGVIPYRDGKLGLVDLDVLLGVRTLEDVPETYILAFAEGRFGLLCKELLPPKTLTKEDVKWRKERGDRPWSLGTLREQLCPLMDLDEIEALLHR